MFSKLIKIILMVGGVLGSMLFYDSINAEAASKTETVRYQTKYRNKQYNKQAVVYLPTGYTEDKKYNVLYLMHGSTEGSRDFYEDGRFKRLFDRLERNGRLKDTIVVLPTYYPNRSFVDSDYSRDNRLNYAFARNELVNDLVPAVERRYSTYANGTSKEQLRASRDHRAFGGFSMGGVTTWYTFEQQLPYFKTYLPMAGDIWSMEDETTSADDSDAARRFTRVVRNNSGLSFKILAGVGENDGTSASMTPQINALRQTSAFDRQNLKYYQAPDGTHTPQTIAQIVDHFANQIFDN